MINLWIRFVYGDKIAELHHSGSESGVVADPPSPTPASSMAAGGLKPSTALKPSQRSG
ncbi:MAG: hypothetical protein F2780_02455 [Actinobacteria bacterium]|nr:hypothetical protein [Actinomycetota bacterium]MSX36020.1 hypothetical protein [Actinomycetota bacterium]MSX76587.1 hypothetical protein [Actinomycetota bacterium]MUH55678.1 hypothetical protein [Actinomycetota bacterium]